MQALSLKYSYFFCLVFGFSSLFAQTFSPIPTNIESARLAGFGGAYTSLEAGIDTLSTNPAALANVNKRWSFARLSMNIDGPIFEIPTIMQSDEMTNDLLDLIAQNRGVHLGTALTGPIAFALVDRNFGFGIFNRSIVIGDLPAITSAKVLVGEEILLTGAYGLDVYSIQNHSFALGLQLKGYFQTFLGQTGTALSVISTFENLDLNEIPAFLSIGFGIDVGFIYRFGKNFQAGLVCKDLFTPVYTSEYASFSEYLDGTPIDKPTNTRLDPQLNFGISYSVPVPADWIVFSGFKIMADYKNMLDFLKPVYRNPILNLAFGTELTFMDVVSLRAGLHEGYLASGLGLNLTYFVIDFAMYGSELGLEPGARPNLNMAFSISFEY